MMEAEIFGLLSGGADVTIIGIGLMLLRVERRIYRLEMKVFGFAKGGAK